MVFYNSLQLLQLRPEHYTFCSQIHFVKLNSLGLGLIEGLYLVTQLSFKVVHLLFHPRDVGLIGNAMFLQVTAQFSYLTLALLVEVNLGSSGTTSLIQTCTQVIQLTGKGSTLLLSLNIDK